MCISSGRYDPFLIAPHPFIVQRSYAAGAALAALASVNTSAASLSSSSRSCLSLASSSAANCKRPPVRV